MRFLDLDLDFFLNENAYRCEPGSGRLSSGYRPWSIARVRNFLEKRCGLSRAAPLPGRAVETHDGVFDFWRSLVKSGSLELPFEVVHIDAHPDLLVGQGMYLASGLLYVDFELLLAVISRKQVHQGNYLTFAIARGWIASLLWIPLQRLLKAHSKFDGDARAISLFSASPEDKPGTALMPGNNFLIPFRILPWRKFKAGEKFDYIALSRSPEFTPPESDSLVPVIEEYIRPI